MSVVSIQGEYFRCLTKFSWSFSPGLNWFCGDNATGKTTLLECLFWSVTGRSFRVRDARAMIQEGAPYCSVRASFSDPVCEIALVRHRTGGLKVKMDHLDVKRWSDVASQLPVVFIDTHTHRQFSEQVDTRRKWFEWIMFHVKHSYHLDQLAYKKAMDQRMQALKMGQDPAPWEHMMCQSALLIEAHRAEGMTWVKEAWSQCDGLAQSIEIRYEPGYEGESLELLLFRQRRDDLRRGYAQSGPHRFDIGCYWGDLPYHQRLSLGQQKLIITELMLLSANILWKKTAKKALWLMDDVASELDDRSRRIMLSKLEQMDLQCIMTTLDAHWKPSHSTPNNIESVKCQNLS